jgi:hypothetical protein
MVAAEIVGNRILLPVSVNGAPPATFILDTGAAGTPMAAEYAKKAGIVSSGKTQAKGAGGTVDVGVATKVRFETGGLTFLPERTPLIPLEPVSLRGGRPISGVLGYEAFDRAIVAVDYAGGGVTFHDPHNFTPPAGAVSVPLHFNHRIPLIDVRLTLPDGRVLPARLVVDTGAGSGLVLTRAFTNEHNIEVDGGIETSLGLGVGGAIRERIGRIARVEVSGFTVERPVVNLSHATAGALGDPNLDGLLGGEILRKFTVIFDYDRKRMWLAPNRTFADAIEFEMAGAMLATRDAAFDTIIVRDVLASSPAAEGGIRIGDELRAIDGQAVTPAQLDEIRRRFRQPGVRHELTIVRDGAEMVVPIVTRRLL